MSTLQDPTNRAASTDVSEFISDLDGGIFERKLSIALSQVAASVVDLDKPGKVQISARLSQPPSQPPALRAPLEIFMDQATAVATAIATLTLSQLPTIGQPLDAGTFVGLTTTADGKHCAVVLLDDKPSKRLNWDDAQAWADSVGGTLPSRPVAALLFANARSSFEPNWHWTCEEFEYDRSCAWNQYFFSGNQYDLGKSYEARARAVRLIHISA